MECIKIKEKFIPAFQIWTNTNQSQVLSRLCVGEKIISTAVSGLWKIQWQKKKWRRAYADSTYTRYDLCFVVVFGLLPCHMYLFTARGKGAGRRGPVANLAKLLFPQTLWIKHLIETSRPILASQTRWSQVKICSNHKVFLCFNWAPRHEGVLGSGGIAPRILW